jgi:hypothetical protein
MQRKPRRPAPRVPIPAEPARDTVRRCSRQDWVAQTLNPPSFAFVPLSSANLDDLSGRRDLNPRRRAPKARALPDCATPRGDLRCLASRRSGDYGAPLTVPVSFRTGRETPSLSSRVKQWTHKSAGSWGVPPRCAPPKKLGLSSSGSRAPSTRTVPSPPPLSLFGERGGYTRGIAFSLSRLAGEGWGEGFFPLRARPRVGAQDNSTAFGMLSGI